MARRRPSPTGAAAVLTVALLASLSPSTTHAFLHRPLRSSPLPRLPTATAATTTTMAAAATSTALPPSTAIVGAGPTGLFTALVLARRGYQNITVYDRLARPDDPSSPNWGNPYRSYNLGLGARGQIALGAAEVWDSIEPFCAQAIGRKDWTPEQGERPEQIYTEREYKTQVIQRDRIASCLLAEVEKKYKDQITVLHDVECVGLTWLDEAGAREEAKSGSQQRRGVRVRLHRELEEGKLEQWTEDARWVIGADGVRSALRGALEAKTTPSPNNKKKTEKPVRAHKLPERNEFVYKILPLDLRPKYGTGPGWRPDLNYSARTKGEVTIEALPTKEGVYVGVVLFRPTCPAIAGIKDKEDARQFFAGSFPQFIDVIKEEDLARFATGPTFRLPSFSYAGPNINYKDNTLLLGDCIHSVKPYFGLGLNSALEDVMSLNRCLEETGDDLGKALPLFSSRIAPQAKALVEFQASFDYDAKTTEGFLRFVLPLILDGIFHRYFPALFAPNGIRLLQDHRSTFTQTRRRKRRDRVGQALVIGTVVAGLGKAVVWVVREGVRVCLKR